MPGGRCFHEDAGVAPASVLAALRRADAADVLPRLGGMARSDGVVIVSERYWAFAGYNGEIREGTMPRAPTLARRIPLVRGLVRLGTAVAPLFRGAGVATTRERLFLLALLVVPFLVFLVPSVLHLPIAVTTMAGLVAWLMRGRTLNLHGAEHRSVAAAEERRLLATWSGDVRPSRISERCGTNFAALAVPVAAVADQAWILPTAIVTPLVVTLVALALTMELWEAVQASTSRAMRALLLPGLALQRLTTREPSLAETRVALIAVAHVLRRELD